MLPNDLWLYVETWCNTLSIVLLTVGICILNNYYEQKLLEEIENNKEKVDECQKYAKAYIDAVKVGIKSKSWAILCTGISEQLKTVLQYS